MKGLYFVLAGLLVLVVALAGCVGKKAEQPSSALPAEQLPQPASGTPAIEGDIAAPEEGGVQIEEAQSSADENVDLGSLT